MKPISRPTAGTANWPARSARLAHHAPSKRLAARGRRRTCPAPRGHHRQHAHVGPGQRAAGAPPPQNADGGLRGHDARRPARASWGRTRCSTRDGRTGWRQRRPRRGGGHQAAEDEQGADCGAQPASANQRRPAARRARSGSARRRRRRSGDGRAVGEERSAARAERERERRSARASCRPTSRPGGRRRCAFGGRVQQMAHQRGADDRRAVRQAGTTALDRPSPPESGTDAATSGHHDAWRRAAAGSRKRRGGLSAVETCRPDVGCALDSSPETPVGVQTCGNPRPN